MEQATRLAGIVMFDGVEVLDFAGPFEVFTVGGRAAAEQGGDSLLQPVLISESGGTVTCTGNLRVETDYAIDDAPALGLLLVPGGWGTRREAANVRLLDWIAARAGEAELTLAICTGSFLLAERGLLDGKRATTHWASIDRMIAAYPAIDVQRDARVVSDGTVMTSAGISAGIDLALAVIERLFGRAVRETTARQMEYDDRG
jgi:transcriptional regulator GlxA family with amidase domain